MGLFGKPCRKVNSAVNCPGARDSIRSCSRLAGPSFPEFPPELFEFPEFGDGEFTLCRRLSITPLIDTNLFILLDDILVLIHPFFLFSFFGSTVKKKGIWLNTYRTHCVFTKFSQIIIIMTFHSFFIFCTKVPLSFFSVKSQQTSISLQSVQHVWHITKPLSFDEFFQFFLGFFCSFRNRELT